MLISEHDLSILEFPKILAKLATYCHYPENEQFALKIRPFADLDKANFEQRLTEAALELTKMWGEAPLYGLTVLNPYLKRVSLDASLNCAELAQISTFLRAINRLHAYIQPAIAEDEDFKQLIPPFQAYLADSKQAYQCAEFLNLDTKYNAVLLLLACLPEQPDLLKELERCIMDDNNLQDNASSELAKIRQRIKEQENKVRQSLEQLIKSNNSALQDNVITQRNNRFVVPVKASFKQQVPGLVHDSSASAQTLFIEPLAVVELNNEIRELELAEAKEIAKILFRLSQLVKAVSPELKLASNLLKIIDFSFAKAKLAKSMQANATFFVEGQSLHLIKARHPLLDVENIVPLDLTLQADIEQLLITGPNTGGKTVCLKTVALLQVMAQSGLAIPAQAESKLPFYKHIFVDIGDEQSVKLNLSTFSGHMRKVVHILEVADSSSLVVLDELGSGTDPMEGAALARAIMEMLLQRHVMTLASTHYRELKIYALDTPHVLNAACEFDTVTMQPTYHLLLGAVGVSNAFTIAKNLGLDKDVISLAQTYLSNEEQNFDQALSKIEAEGRQTRQLQVELDTKLRDLAVDKAQAERERNKLQEQRSKLKADLLQENQRTYKQKLSEVDSLLAELKELLQTCQREKVASHKNSLKDAVDLASLLKQEVKGDLSKLQGKIHDQTLHKLFQADEKSDQVLQNVNEVELGAYYLAPKLSLQGQALAVDAHKKQVTLKHKNMQVNVPVQGLIKINKLVETEVDPAADLKAKYRLPKGKAGANNENYRKLQANSAKNLPLELNLIGQRYNEAEMALEQYVDQAVLGAAKTIRVVHGKGSGILRKMVENFAKQDKRVESYRLGELGEGDTGVTIISLR